MANGEVIKKEIMGIDGWTYVQLWELVKVETFTRFI